jgi:NAD(P)-dependent dehydrogenase (short-subunit alcohol dehydrogenase family)/acyl carrier protein
MEKSQGKKSRLRKEGVYLITGGLGGIGLVLAEFLARRVSPKLVLIGRSDFPARDRWERWLARHNEEDIVSCKIKKLHELERMGAKVLIFSADVTSPEQMQDLVHQTSREFGQINGVIHAAGVPDGAMIQLRTRETSEKIFAAKVKGTLLLDRVLEDVELDFFVICSSLDSIITAAGQVGYCGANAFINAFANYKAYTGSPFTVSINWPRWQSLGIAIIAENLYKELRGEDLTGGLAAEDGVEAFSRILECSLSQVAVIDRDLRVLLERDYTSTTGSLMEEFETVKTSEDTAYQRPQLTTEYVAPGNEPEKKIAEIWQTIFGISQIGVRDDFFELGGDSLKAIIVISKIHKELNVEIPISGFFSAPTIEKLAGYINETEKSDYLAIESAEQREYYVLSSAQRRFYILQQMDIQSMAYNMTMINIVEGQLDRERLEKDFQKLIDRHENLRTSFPLVDGEAVQKVHEKIDFSIAYVECSESEAKKIATNFVEPFDLSEPPLLRIGLIKPGEQKHILMLDMHHIISDGQSLVLFIQDLLVSYLGKELPPLKLQYKDFSRWQHNMLISGKLEKQEQYWLEVFPGELPRLGMPTDYPRPAIQSFAGDTLQFRFGRELMPRLNRLMRETGATLYMVLLAAYSILLSKYSGQTDIIVGSPAAGRNHPDLENIIGLLMETIAIRSYPEDNKTVEELLEEVKKSTLNVYENQAYPFGELLKKVADENDLSRNPLFDVMLIVQNVITPHEKLGIGDLKFFPYKGDSIRVSKVDITLEAMEIEDGVHFVVEYCTKLFKKETMERLITFFQEILSIVVDNRKIKLKDIKMSHVVSAAEADVFEDDGTDFGF